MRTTDLMSAMAANRKQFFDLIHTVERECSCSIDEEELTAVLDAEYDDRTALSTFEANELLLRVTRQTGHGRGSGGG